MPLTHSEMASSRKRQEDKNLKILRELVTLSHNKKCFDCGQRGPTYVNMTIGAFVCTSCSGLLRGLNPPHRIKSISMASFNQQEIDFLQKHGNQVCQNTWLALWESTSMEHESREEQKMKDHLVHKYERKVWYSDQKRNIVNQVEEPAAKPLKALLGNNVQQAFVSADITQKPPVAVSTVPSFPPSTQFGVNRPQGGGCNMDLLGNLGSDPFASATPSINKPPMGPFQPAPVQATQQPLFDAFTSSEDSTNQASFDLFVNSAPNPLATNSTLSNTPPVAPLGNGSIDKYAALAELDMNNTQSVFSSSSIFGTSPATCAASTQPNPFMSPSINSSGAAVFQQQQQKPVNPFQSSSSVQSTSIFPQAAPPGGSVDISNQSSSFSWDMSNTSMNMNSVASNSNMQSSNAMAPNQANSNFIFGGTPQTNNEFMNQVNMTGHQPNQSVGFSNQTSMFPNPMGFPNQPGFGNQFNTQQQKQQPQQPQQQPSFARQPVSQTLFQPQFTNQTQYNYPMENQQTSHNPSHHLFNANFQQFASTANPIQMQKNQPSQLSDHSPFGISAPTPFNQPVKSTNPFM